MKPDIRRFWELINNPDIWEGEYGGVDVDALAFINGVKSMANGRLTEHQAQINFMKGLRDKPDKCNCPDCKFAREIFGGEVRKGE